MIIILLQQNAQIILSVYLLSRYSLFTSV